MLLTMTKKDWEKVRRLVDKLYEKHGQPAEWGAVELEWHIMDDFFGRQIKKIEKGYTAKILKLK